MHKPLESVVVLAHFALSEQGRARAVAALEKETDWQKWINHVELHGLSGLVNKHLDEHDLPIPQALHVPLKALKVRHQAAAGARFKALTEIDQIFKANAIPYLGLKGVSLMPHLFKEDHLRPMRDMDLLLPDASLNRAGELLRDLGFNLPHEQPSKFMRDMHQLPNATKTVDGFMCSVELHRDGISREVSGHLYFPDSAPSRQQILWRGLEFDALQDIAMLHQVCRHLEGLHSGAVLKLINVVDVVVLAQHVLEAGKWNELESTYPHVTNSLRCLHLLTPLPDSLQQALAPLSSRPVADVGEIMGSLRNALITSRPMRDRLQLLFRPSDWWLYLYYNVDPTKSLFLIKWFKHPLRVATWLGRRAYSGLLGG